MPLSVETVELVQAAVDAREFADQAARDAVQAVADELGIEISLES